MEKLFFIKKLSSALSAQIRKKYPKKNLNPRFSGKTVDHEDAIIQNITPTKSHLDPEALDRLRKTKPEDASFI